MDSQSVHIVHWHSITWSPSETIQLPKSYFCEMSKFKLLSEINCWMISCMNTKTTGIRGLLYQAHSLDVRQKETWLLRRIKDWSKWVSRTIKRPHCSGNEINNLQQRKNISTYQRKNILIYYRVLMIPIISLESISFL